MIDQLLQRIAQRGAGPAPERNDSSLVSSNPSSQPYFPAGSSRTSERSAAQPDRALAMWQQSKIDYLQASALQAVAQPPGIPIVLTPEVFAQFGPAHCAVAALLWAEQQAIAKLTLTSPSITVRGSEGLVAVYQTLDQTVLINPQVSPAGLHSLSLRAHVTHGPAHWPKELLHNATVSMLLWFYAQTVPTAVHLLPDAVISQSLQLRKFPAVAAQALEVRHLGLIHRFSAGAVSFDQLLRQASDDEVGRLCADLTALYLTGALSADAPQQPREAA
jgi:hypothetical protein